MKDDYFLHQSRHWIFVFFFGFAFPSMALDIVHTAIRCDKGKNMVLVGTTGARDKLLLGAYRWKKIRRGELFHDYPAPLIEEKEVKLGLGLSGDEYKSANAKLTLLQDEDGLPSGKGNFETLSSEMTKVVLQRMKCDFTESES